MLSKLSATLMLAAAVSANCTTGPATLYATGYSGNFSSLAFAKAGAGYSLTQIQLNKQCGANPVWLEHDKANKLIYCLDETGSINSFKADAGKLTLIKSVNTTFAPVASIFFNKGDKKAIALAHYGSATGGPPGGAGVTTYLAPADGSLKLVANITATGSGPNKDRQGAAHIHQTILDPTGKFIVAPDLGADQVRVYAIDAATSNLKELTAVKATAGSGPRHGVFQKAGNSTFFHLIAELGNSITSYKVTYDKDALSMAQIAQVSTFGNGTVPKGAAAGEIALSHCGGFVTISNRLDNSFQIPNWNPANKTAEASDSLAVFKTGADGKLTFVQIAPAGGQSPRQFSTNKAGTLLAVANSLTSRVVVMQRDPKTGQLGRFVANYTLDAATFVGWDEGAAK